MGARFRTAGREEKGLAHLVVLLAGREGGGSVLQRVFVAGEGPDEDPATQMRASRIRDIDTDIDVDAGGRREPGAGSDGVAAVLRGSDPAPWSRGGRRCW